MARSERNQSRRWILINMFLFLQVVWGYHNVTIDDTDPAIVYRGAWSTATREECYGGSCHFTTINGVTALYPLSGAVRLYFVGQILLDSTIKVVIDGLILVPAIAESSPQGILWDSGMQFNPSKQYIIQVEKAGPSGTGREFYVDAFIKTVPDEGEFPTTSASNTNPASSSASSSSASSSSTISSGISIISNTISGGLSTLSTVVSGPSITDINDNPISPDSSSTSTTSGPNAGGSSSSDMKPSIKAGIIGGILGGVAFMSIIAVLFFCLGRGRRSRRDSISIQPPDPKPYDTGLNEAAPPTTASISVMDVSSPPPPLHLKEMRERQGAGVASSEGSGSQILPTEEASNTPIVNRVFYHPSEWQSPTSQSQPWLMTNPPAYTVRPISGHVHAGGDTLSDFDRP